jgi:hypothetical protein
MPNYKLATDVAKNISTTAATVADQTRFYAAGAFPLTTDQVQRLILPIEDINSLTELETRGVAVTKYSTQHVLFHAERWAGLQRSVVVWLRLPKEIYASRSTNYQGGTEHKQDFEFNSEYHHTAQLAWLKDPGVVEPVVAWLHRAVRGERLATMATLLVEDAMAHLKSTGEIMANWPNLASFATDPKWVPRFRNTPTGNAAKRWHMASPPLPSVKLRAAVDAVLLGAQLLEPYKQPPGTIQAAVRRHQVPDSERHLRW